MKKPISTILREYSVITLGALIYAIGISVFVIPNTLVTGGMAGVSEIIYYFTGFPISYSYAIINFFLLALGVKTLGGGFGIKTIFAVGVLTILLKIVPMGLTEEFVNGIAIKNGKLISAIIAGAMEGLGIAMMMKYGGCSGGTDIIALIINKRFRIPTAGILLALDVIIIGGSLIIPNAEGWSSRFITLVYGYILAGVSSFTLDRLLNINRQSVQLFVISKKYKEIADRVNNETQRGVTLFNAVGWYSKSDVQVLMIVAKKTQMTGIMNIIRQEDPRAFTSIGSVVDVFGEGFEEFKKSETDSKKEVSA